MNRRLKYTAVALALALLPGCNGCSDPSLQENLSKLVWMKYAHVANVREMDAPSPTGTAKLVGTDPGAFWAVFDICSLDVQGSAMTSFNYDAANFYVDGGTVSYGPMNPGMVNAASVPRSSSDPQVQSMVHQALKLSPSPQTFAKQLYPTLRYRIAVFVKENPSGYQGGSLTLKYGGHPTTVQDISPGNPDVRSFFQYQASPPIVSTCP
jgi:hypothetical protein